MAGPLNVKQVNFKDGVYLAGVVKQSVGVNAPEGSTLGVAQVEKAEVTNHGAVITMMGRVFLVPWAAISSVELLPEEIEAPASKPAPQAARR